MTIDTRDLLNSILKSLDRFQHVDPSELPNIDLYADQVTTFMEQKMRNTTRNPQEDKIMTKTMINNYVKNDLLPPPEKKKYSREHMIMLMFIYYFKGVMSIGDIQTLLEPLSKGYFSGERSINLEDIYNEVFSMEKGEISNLKKDVVRKFHTAEETFENEGIRPGSKEDQFLKLFSFVCQLSFDVYVKKLLIEKLVDGMNESIAASKAKPQKTKTKKEKEKNEKNA